MAVRRGNRTANNRNNLQWQSATKVTERSENEPGLNTEEVGIDDQLQVCRMIGRRDTMKPSLAAHTRNQRRIVIKHEARGEGNNNKTQAKGRGEDCLLTLYFYMFEAIKYKSALIILKHTHLSLH